MTARASSGITGSGGVPAAMLSQRPRPQADRAVDAVVGFAFEDADIVAADQDADVRAAQAGDEHLVLHLQFDVVRSDEHVVPDFPAGLEGERVDGFDFGMASSGESMPGAAAAAGGAGDMRMLVSRSPIPIRRRAHLFEWSHAPVAILGDAFGDAGLEGSAFPMSSWRSARCGRSRSTSSHARFNLVLYGDMPEQCGDVGAGQILGAQGEPVLVVARGDGDGGHGYAASVAKVSSGSSRSATRMHSAAMARSSLGVSLLITAEMLGHSDSKLIVAHRPWVGLDIKDADGAPAVVRSAWCSPCGSRWPHRVMRWPGTTRGGSPCQQVLSRVGCGQVRIYNTGLAQDSADERDAACEHVWRRGSSCRVMRLVQHCSAETIPAEVVIQEFADAGVSIPQPQPIGSTINRPSRAGVPCTRRLWRHHPVALSS